MTQELTYWIIVVGVGKGTKHLNQFLGCTKVSEFQISGNICTHAQAQEYHATCLLGCETDTYDSEGKCVRLAPWRHVTREQVESALSKFTGEILQTPPM